MGVNKPSAYLRSSGKYKVTSSPVVGNFPAVYSLYIVYNLVNTFVNTFLWLQCRQDVCTSPPTHSGGDEGAWRWSNKC